MRTTDWNYDFSSLPFWENREKLPFVYDEYYEIPQTDMLCCLYSIDEVRMLDYRGFLAILKNKEEPELVLNIAREVVSGVVKGYNFSVAFFASEDGKLIFLQPCVYNHKQERQAFPILILDITRNLFSYAVPKNAQLVEKISQNSSSVFTVDFYNTKRSKKIRTRWLKWYPLEQLPMLPRLICGE